MCGLCGLFGSGGHWTDAAVHAEASVALRTRRAERAAQVRAANAVLTLFALRLDNWQGTSFVLSSPTGARTIIEALPDIWRTAATMLGRPIDPLDPALLARLDAAAP